MHRGGIELLGELLRNGAAATSRRLPEESAFHHGARQGYEVDARMVVEPHILSGHESLHEIWRELLVGHRYAVGPVEVVSAKDMAVG